jgi:hypothetical protein
MQNNFSFSNFKVNPNFLNISKTNIWAIQKSMLHWVCIIGSVAFLVLDAKANFGRSEAAFDNEKFSFAVLPIGMADSAKSNGITFRSDTLVEKRIAKKDTSRQVYDSTYFRKYADQITCRFYFSRKYTRLLIGNKESGFELDYRPNTTLNMGVGATYKSLTINIAYGFPFLNQTADRAKTRYLDLQAHIYGNKFNVDFFGQLYNGLYLNPRGKGTLNNSYYVRPDLKLREVGLSCEYVFNHRRFSYRASYLQNEWQRKSAGTFLLGAEAFVGWAYADSSVFPTRIPLANAPRATQVQFYEFGPNAGYAYNLVIAKHFFISGAFSVGFDYNRTSYWSTIKTTTVEGFSPNTNLRFFAGYNSARNALSFTYTSSVVSLLAVTSYYISINTGNIRFNYIRRFSGGPRLRKVLHKIDHFLKND